MVMNILCRSRYCFIHYATRSTALFRTKQLSRRGLVQLSSEDAYQIEQLGRRGLVKLSGQDVVPYLQGLITNDVSNVTSNGRALYTHFLNHKGRILYDALVCKHSPTVLLIECDILIRDDIISYLKMYRVRKKVDIEPLNRNIWSLFDDCLPCSDPGTQTREHGAHSRHRYVQVVDSLCRKNVLAFQDPRIPSLGVRIIASSSTSLAQVLSECGIRTVESNNYMVLRYKLGVPEGVSELPIGKCLPMEMNCDYLNGVSFQKGCYIGQELTARTYHTGVVRKRVMPLILSSVPDRKLDYDSVIVTEDDQVVGKLKGIYQNYCIALLRVTQTLKHPSKLRVSSFSAYTYKPFWWPSEREDQRGDSAS